jgi:hypothetical protein
MPILEYKYAGVAKLLVLTGRGTKGSATPEPLGLYFGQVCESSEESGPFIVH